MKKLRRLILFVPLQVMEKKKKKKKKKKNLLCWYG